MKTNSSAQSNVKILMGCLAIAALVLLELTVGKSLLSRIDQVSAIRTDAPQAPNTDIWDFVAAR